MIIDKIFHISDVHIRNYQRHTEYNNVFKRLYKYIKDNKTPGSVIYLAGDIVHQKTDLSPELVHMVGRFLKSCADICPTILICGNHDTNLNNNSRLDALSPIVENLKHRRLHYWKNSGIYKLTPDSNISFGVCSVFDTIDQWPPASDLPKSDIKIALHHGAIMGATTDLNHVIENDAVTIKNFRGYDYGMFGDIHKQQYLNPAKTMAYSSSLIQQNYGETVKHHGLIVWNIAAGTNEFVEIENDIAYATFEFDDNQLVTNPEYFTLLPKYLRVKVKHRQTELDIIHQFLDKLKSKHVFKEYSLRKLTNHSDIKTADLSIGNVRDIEYQNQLITEFVDNKDTDFVDGIRHINRTVNTQLNNLDKNARNTTWKLLYMEFDNMFSYGSNNSVDFRNMSGIQGIFAPNAAGKSSLLEVLSFALFDKCSKTFKADEILNNQSDSFVVKVGLEIDNEEYTIIRQGSANKDRKVRVNVDFYSSSEQLRGKDRDDTNKIIRSYLGSYDDFMLTALSTQTDNRNFIFKTQRERKELLYSFLDLKLFTDLNWLAKGIIKDKQAVVSNLSTKVNLVTESETIGEINRKTQLINKYEVTVSECHTQISELDAIIKASLLSIVDIPTTRNRIQIENSLQDMEHELSVLVNTLIPDLNSTIKQLNSDIDKCGTTVIDYDREKKIKFESTSLTAKIKETETKLNTIKNKMTSYQKEIQILETYEYDPNCEFCCNSDFVKSAKLAKEKYPQLVNEFNSISADLVNSLDQMNEYKLILGEFKELHNKINNKQLIESKLQTAQQTVEVYRLRFKELKSSIARVEQELRDFTANEKQYTENIRLRNIIEENEKQIQDLKDRSKKLEILMTNFKVDVSKLQESLKQNNDNKIELNKLTNEILMYQTYANAVSSNGIPYNILKQIMPVIESEVNNLLHGICDFQVEFSNDEKSIYCHLVYGDQKWPVELASGMERFLVSVASRVALIEVTSLARPNFIAIDEGFGVLDANSISNVYMLLDKLKDKFDFIMCITHLESLKDVADNILTISKHDNKSLIRYI